MPNTKTVLTPWNTVGLRGSTDYRQALGRQCVTAQRLTMMLAPSFCPYFPNTSTLYLPQAKPSVQKGWTHSLSLSWVWMQSLAYYFSWCICLLTWDKFLSQGINLQYRIAEPSKLRDCSQANISRNQGSLHVCRHTVPVRTSAWSAWTSLSWHLPITQDLGGLFHCLHCILTLWRCWFGRSHLWTTQDLGGSRSRMVWEEGTVIWCPQEILTSE